MGIKLLLDTQVLLWSLSNDNRLLSKSARDLIEDPDNRRMVSAVTAFEISQKIRVGKLEVDGFPHNWKVWMNDLMAEELPLTSQHSIVAGNLTWSHRDPFDRMLVAQSQIEQLTLLTADQTILKLPTVNVFNAGK